MTIETIKEKVRALLMKAADAAATPSEAEGAMRAAQKLMAKYQVSEDDLGSLDADSFKEGRRESMQHPKKGWYTHPIDRYCASIVGKFCGVQPWMHKEPATGEEYVKCLGLESDVELFLWMLSAFKEQFEHDWLIYKRFQMQSKRLLDVKEARIAFAHGFSNAVNDRLKGWMMNKSPMKGSAADTANALVLKKMDVVAAEMARRGIHLGTAVRSGRGSQDTAAAGAGYNSGNAAQAAKATAANRSIMIGSMC